MRRRAEQGLAERGFGLAEGDRFQAPAVIARNDRADMALADHVGLDDPHRPGGDARRGPAHAVGAAAVERRHQIGRYPARGEQRVEQQRTRAERAGDGLRQTLVEEIGERLDPVGGDRQPRRHGVPAARDEQAGILRREHRRAEIDAGDRAARALAHAVFVECDHDGGAAGFLLEAPGNDADHPGVPARARDHRDRAVGPGGALRLGGLLHQRLDRAAFLVQPVEFGGDATRLLGIARGEQPHAEIGAPDPSAGVDPRAEREAEVARGGRAGEARRLDQRSKADIAALRHHLEALRHEGAVEPLQLRHVGDGAERDDVEQVDEARLDPVGEDASPAQRADQRGTEQEGNAHRGEMAVRRALALVEPIGIDERVRDRKRGGAFVVIDHDHVHARGLRHVERLERLRAAIDRDDQRRARLRQPHQRLARGAVAFHQPVGDIGRRLDTQIAQQQDHQRRGGGAVHVVIAKDRDFLARLHGVGEPLGRPIHIAEDRGIGHEAADAGRLVRIDRLTRAAAREQELGDEIVGPIARIARIRLERPPPPWLTEDRGGNVQNGAHPTGRRGLRGDCKRFVLSTRSLLFSVMFNSFKHDGGVTTPPGRASSIRGTIW